MSRILLSQNTHPVNILAPVDINGGVNSDVFSMKDCSHVSILIQLGVTGGATTITVEECDDFTPSNSTAIAFKYAAEETAGGDTLGSLTDATVSGFAASTNDGIFYVIEIDAEDLSEGYPCLRVCFSDPSGSTIGSAVAVLTGLSYQGDQTRTQIA